LRHGDDEANKERRLRFGKHVRARAGGRRGPARRIRTRRGNDGGGGIAVTMIRVLLADDHAPTRGEMRDALEQDERFDVIAEAADGPGAVQAAVREQPDICVLDIRMPGSSGIAAAREITSRLPETKVVMLTISDDDDDLLNALRAGAA